MGSVRLPIDVRSVAFARVVLRQTLQQHGAQSRRDTAGDTLSDAALMLSELVTNAIRLTRSLLLLEITIVGSTLHVAVIDDAPGTPALRDLDHLATGGRGLAIVDTLADRWGYTRDADRKRVWFDLKLP